MLFKNSSCICNPPKSSSALPTSGKSPPPPNNDLWFVAVVTFEPLPDGGTRYTARVRHWTQEGMEKHAAMGFADGWNKAFDQLVEQVA